MFCFIWSEKILTFRGWADRTEMHYLLPSWCPVLFVYYFHFMPDINNYSIIPQQCKKFSFCTPANVFFLVFNAKMTFLYHICAQKSKRTPCPFSFFILDHAWWLKRFMLLLPTNTPFSFKLQRVLFAVKKLIPIPDTFSPCAKNQ